MAARKMPVKKAAPKKMPPMLKKQEAKEAKMGWAKA